MKPGSMKWQAGPGCIFCVEEVYEPNEGLIVVPNTVTQTKEKIAKIVSVGPDVVGFAEGDYVAFEKAAKCQGGMFVRVRDILGRLVPKEAPNSATAVPPRGGAELTADVDGKKLVNDMVAAD